MPRFLLIVALCAAGCTSTFLDAKDYARTCSADADCVAVVTGEICRVCPCPNAAINKGQLERYTEDRVRAEDACDPRPAVACAPCQDVTVCVAGTCSVRAP